jgi:hypothetical protein
METFAAQMSALKEYRSKGEQKMTVQHVHVAEGGQAIVGNVNARFEGIGARKKSEDQPHALAYAPGVEMPRQIEAERATAPRAGSLPDARRGRRGSYWQPERAEARAFRGRGDRDAANGRRPRPDGPRNDDSDRGIRRTDP